MSVNCKLKITFKQRNWRYGNYFQPDVSSSRKRNKQRSGIAQVPDKAIFITASKLMPPSYAEGYDRLYYVRIVEGSTVENLEWEIEEIPFRDREDEHV